MSESEPKKKIRRVATHIRMPSGVTISVSSKNIITKESVTEERRIQTPDTNPKEFTRLPNGQGFRHKITKEIWKKDKLHKDHWDVSDKKGRKVKEIDYSGAQLWPDGPRHRNRGGAGDD